jgi:hypothetical protein
MPSKRSLRCESGSGQDNLPIFLFIYSNIIGFQPLYHSFWDRKMAYRMPATREVRNLPYLSLLRGNNNRSTPTVIPAKEGIQGDYPDFLRRDYRAPHPFEITDRNEFIMQDKIRVKLLKPYPVLRTTRLPMEYPAPKELITPISSCFKSWLCRLKAMMEPAEAVLA